MNRSKRTVYSTEHGRLCPDCGQPENACRCQAEAPHGDGIVRIQRQTKGRKGKPVCLVTGLALQTPELKKLAGELKSRCGVGGSVEGFDILIQGDKRELLKTLLEERGYNVKLAGG